MHSWPIFHFHFYVSRSVHTLESTNIFAHTYPCNHTAVNIALSKIAYIHLRDFYFLLRYHIQSAPTHVSPQRIVEHLLLFVCFLFVCQHLHFLHFITVSQTLRGPAWDRILYRWVFFDLRLAYVRDLEFHTDSFAEIQSLSAIRAGLWCICVFALGPQMHHCVNGTLSWLSNGIMLTALLFNSGIKADRSWQLCINFELMLTLSTTYRWALSTTCMYMYFEHNTWAQFPHLEVSRRPLANHQSQCTLNKKNNDKKSNLCCMKKRDRSTDANLKTVRAKK